MQRFIAGSRDQTAEQIQRLANVTQILVDNKMALENVLHVAPNALANAYNIYNPDTGEHPSVGCGLQNFSEPGRVLCARSARWRTPRRPRRASCARSTSGPALRTCSTSTNYLPIP